MILNDPHFPLALAIYGLSYDQGVAINAKGVAITVDGVAINVYGVSITVNGVAIAVLLVDIIKDLKIYGKQTLICD
ncbi:MULTISPECIES: hypothetical protein [Vibrio harveyi group]|uniref:Uncharacterized protein n=1 Tax=Vibrio campbellii TaxID=680 RepID=A0AAQ2Y659_9VIBR|nr:MULTISPECIES: hypothetical protein [Vibrio harveyi group]WDG12004.1 hypothetical protein PUN50_27310 [Vibrio campbellii]|tara:strand:+ start:192 stop:419 length:228 start_codon:yes stop_codon:yes gene_type:complete